MRRLSILIDCEFSGVLRESFLQYHGVDAVSCDLLPPEDGRVDYHIQGDAIEAVKSRKWDCVIAFPPCTYLCNSGVRWLYTGGRGHVHDEERWQAMREGAKFFADLWKACGDMPKGFENPVMHGYAQEMIMRLAPGIPMGKMVNFIDPRDFGHAETKKTGLYLHRLPPLVPTKRVHSEAAALSYAQRSRVHYASPGPDRWKKRSRTLPGIAAAMAAQWVPVLMKGAVS